MRTAFAASRRQNPSDPSLTWVGSVCPNWLMARPDVKPPIKLLYVRLVGYAGERDTCWPSKETLARDTGNSVRTIERIVTQLQKLRLVDIVDSIDHGKAYRLLDHPWMHEPVPDFLSMPRKPKEVRKKNQPQLELPGLGTPVLVGLPSSYPPPVLVEAPAAFPFPPHAASPSPGRNPVRLAAVPTLTSDKPGSPNDQVCRKTLPSLSETLPSLSHDILLGNDQEISNEQTKEKQMGAKPPSPTPPAPAVCPIPGQEVVEPVQSVKRDTFRIEIQQAWDRYTAHHDSHHATGPKPKLTEKRRVHLRKRIEEYGLDVVLSAVDALWSDSWRVEHGYTAIDYAIRSAEQLEKLLAKKEPPKAAHRPGGRNIQPAPEGHVGYRARILYTDDGIFDSEGRRLDDEPATQPASASA